MVDVVTEFSRKGALSELLHADDLVVMTKIMEGLRNKFLRYVRPAILHGSEAWCLNECEMGILRRTERSMVIAICGVQLKDRKDQQI